MIKKFAQLITAILILSLSLPKPVQAATGFTVSGKVSTSAGALAGVTLTLGSLTAISNASGNYTISNVPASTTGNLTPSKTGYTFNPVNIPLDVTANRTGQNFIATQLTYSISGKVTTPDGNGLQGVSVFTATTDVNGNYMISNVAYGSVTNLTPSKGGFSFSPPSISVPAITANVTGQNFLAYSKHSYTVSGNITSGSGPVAGVKVTLAGLYSDTTNGNGNFSIHYVPDGTTGDLVPSLAGYTFSPPSINVPPLKGDLTGQYFVGTQITFNISGMVTDGVNPLSGVKVVISGTSYTTNTLADGSYTLANVPYGTSGNLTPTAPDYSFAPPNINISGLTGDLTDQNFVGSQLYVISGKVTVGTSTGAGLANVLVSLGAFSTTTATNGSYNLMSLPAGTGGNLTPTLAGYTFNPANISINNLQANAHQDNFIATLNTYNISGYVTLDGSGLQNVTVAISGTTFSTATAVDGSYSFADVPFGTSGDLTASLAGGYIFAPPSFHIASLSSDLTDQNFAATKVYSISGKVTVGTTTGSGLANVLVSLGALSTATAADGSYTLSNVPAGTTANLTPTLGGYTFNPLNISINNLASDTTGQNFVGMLNTYNISGTVTFGASGLSGVTVALSGTAFSTITAGDGSYTLANVPYGTTGNLTPSLASYGFTPPTIHITSLLGDLSGKNFTASKLFTISGKVTIGTSTTGLAGVTVTLGANSAVTDANGNYTIPSILPGANGLLIASLPGYTFKPTSITILAMTTNLTGKNFAATQTKFAISGNVTINGKGFKGVVIHTTSSSLTIPNVTTNGSGSFTIPNLPSTHIYTVTPLLAGYNFGPPNFVSPALLSNQTANFTATLLFENISGTVSGLGGTIIQIRYGSGKTQLVSTNSSGFYTINNLPENVSYTLTPLSPKLPVFHFNPGSRTIPAGSGSTSSANFTTIWNISGVVTSSSKGLKGVEIDATINGGVHKVLTNSKGAYTLTGVLFGASVVISAKKTGFSFTPGNISFTMGNANLNGQDFSTN